MNLREIMADGYKVFSKMGDASRLKNIDAVQYIDILSNTTGIDITEWDLHEVFAKRGNEFNADRNFINKTFFEHQAKLLSERVAAAPLTIPEEVQQRVNDYSSKTAAKQLQQISAQREQALNQAQQVYQQFETHMREAYQCAVDMDRHARDGGINIGGQLTQLQTDGFWINPVLDGKFLFMLTGQSVVNIYRNSGAGLDVRVDFGKMAARIDLESMNLIVIPFDNNIVAREHYHPHINRTGAVCWGTGQDAAIRSLARGDVLTAMRLLATILVNYNDGNPYVPLQTFADPAQVRKVDMNDPTTHPQALLQELRRREQAAREQMATQPKKD